MEQLRKNRKILRTMFTKSANDLEELLTGEEVNLDVRVAFDMLNNKAEKLKALNEEIYDLLLSEDTEEDLVMTELEACDNYMKRFSLLSLRYESLMQKDRNGYHAASGNPETNSVAPLQGKHKFKLPVIEFKTFSGNIKEWLPFWSQFRKVHEDPDIDCNDKIEYLIQATVPGSRARLLVESFPAVKENYPKIVESLKSRFGREDLQIEVYIRGLLQLIINNATSSNNIDVCSLYDGLETQIRALETLGITTSGYSAVLFPLIESCLPEDLLRVWQRSFISSSIPSEPPDVEAVSLEAKLKHLLHFLRNEVNNEQRIVLAAQGFGLRSETVDNFQETPVKANSRRQPSASALLVQSNQKPSPPQREPNKCVFCNSCHDSLNCFKAQGMTLEKRKELLSSMRACFRCLKLGHQSRQCHARVKCIICGKSHVTLMCFSLSTGGKAVTELKADETPASTSNDFLTCTNGTGSHVFLQTLKVNLNGPHGSKSVRVLIDTGSHNSYILKATADSLGFSIKQNFKIRHCLFGGVSSEQNHNVYDICLSQGNYKCTLEALSQNVICTDVLPVFYGPWMDDLRQKDIPLSDFNTPGPIEVLIGSDVAGKLYTGRTLKLTTGLVAVEMLLGWTLMGKVPIDRPLGHTLSAISLLINDALLSQLWDLDTLGIRDPYEQRSRREQASAAVQLFLESVQVTPRGRYKVRLPWVDGHPPLPSNYELAQKRLKNTLTKLITSQLRQPYDEVFLEWIKDGIIEEVRENQVTSLVHYLPHRPVVKENSTTRIRPVFDASAKDKQGPSLNQCLETGPNLIELIPDILLRFRQHKIGVSADIRKAFLQISIHEADRDFLRFLWVDSEGNEIIYRHKRVVFGIRSSPFLLGATLEYHINQGLKECSLEFSKQTLERLSKSFYVDNCVCSVPDEESLITFRREATTFLEKALFDLRGWEFSHQTLPENSEPVTALLGMEWNTDQDTLGLNKSLSHCFEQFLNTPVTKRIMLSVAQRIFDPIGFTCPTTLVPKLLLQLTWGMKIGWDAEVTPDISKDFKNWLTESKHLLDIKIPRWIHAGLEDAEDWTLHTFCDASKTAYAAVVFLRGVKHGKVFVTLLAAKSRIAPVKRITIPRLELLAAVIGARLYSSVQQSLQCSYGSFFWTDSSTVLAWIRRQEEWNVFVTNRVNEIKNATPFDAWRHVPGHLNPADLPSRGCSASQLKKSNWWEGPEWLYTASDNWPNQCSLTNEQEVQRERKKGLVTSLLANNDCSMTVDDWHMTYFSKYWKTVRMIAWIFRFSHNARFPSRRLQSVLSTEELSKAETFIFKLLQQQSFKGNEEKRLGSFDYFVDKSGIIRLKSRVSQRDDTDQFRYPIILPAKNQLVENLIFDLHIKSCHVRAQGLLGILRENYWIPGGRRVIKSIISKCVVCKRHNGKSYVVDSPALPRDRVREAATFEVTGLDFAGPLYLKNGEKAWICLFTCAVYRAVHLELCTSLSVVNFLQALRRFIARRGRPRTIYSDNGTNFVGTETLFSKLDWDKITTETSIERITWKFNPPSAPWWGGFWERLVGAVKQLLRKTLGRASLNYEELVTVLCDCEAIVNSRPLTYLSDDPEELIPLTPMFFLRDQASSSVCDIDAIDGQSLCKRVVYLRKIREDLHRRFRTEYLGQLKLLNWGKRTTEPKLGDIVLIGNDNEKRLDWTMGRICELMPGKDGQVRLVKVSTNRGTFMRPIQRLYPLECVQQVKVCEPSSSECVPQVVKTTSKKNGKDEADPEQEVLIPRPAPVMQKMTRSGRVSKMPKKYL